MKRLYAELLARAVKNPDYRRKVEAAQRAWLAYVSSEMEAKYAAEDKREYGTVYPMCYDFDEEALTRQRISQLKALLHAREGDVCAGQWARYRELP